MIWQNIALGDLCKVIAGGTPKRSDSNYYGGNIPWVKISDMLQGVITSTEETISQEGLDNSAAKLLPQGTLLLSIFATVGRTAILGIPASTNQAIVGLTLKDENISVIYLRHFLDRACNELANKGRGVAQNNINSSILKAFKIPVPMTGGKPDLEEQRRIASILDQADAIRRKRRQALQLTDDFLRSTFLHLFGDPVTNPKGWDTKELGNFVERLDGGKNLAESILETKYRVLKVSAVTYGTYQPEQSKFVPDSFKVPDGYLVKAGDLLISRANTRELIGATAYVWDTPEHMMLPDKIWKFIWKRSKPIHPLFVHALTKCGSFRNEIGKLASGTSGSMKNIAKPKLLSLRIPEPPFELQEEFAKIVVKHKELSSKNVMLGEKTENLFSSLQQRAFKGEL